MGRLALAPGVFLAIGLWLLPWALGLTSHAGQSHVWVRDFERAIHEVVPICEHCEQLSLTRRTTLGSGG
jgi:hypothetical protein